VRLVVEREPSRLFPPSWRDKLISSVRCLFRRFPGLSRSPRRLCLTPDIACNRVSCRPAAGPSLFSTSSLPLSRFRLVHHSKTRPSIGVLCSQSRSARTRDAEPSILLLGIVWTMQEPSPLRYRRRRMGYTRQLRATYSIGCLPGVSRGEEDRRILSIPLYSRNHHSPPRRKLSSSVWAIARGVLEFGNSTDPAVDHSPLDDPPHFNPSVGE
jgi:hypothetical protein